MLCENGTIQPAAIAPMRPETCGFSLSDHEVPQFSGSHSFSLPSEFYLSGAADLSSRGFYNSDSHVPVTLGVPCPVSHDVGTVRG